MKFSLATVVVLANGIAAMPWAGKAVSVNDDVTLEIKVSQHGGNKVNVERYPICLRVCWPDTPQCPEGWDAKNMGNKENPCWTCCRDSESDL